MIVPLLNKYLWRYLYMKILIWKIYKIIALHILTSVMRKSEFGVGIAAIITAKISMKIYIHMYVSNTLRRTRPRVSDWSQSLGVISREIWRSILTKSMIYEEILWTFVRERNRGALKAPWRFKDEIIIASFRLRDGKITNCFGNVEEDGVNFGQTLGSFLVSV